jgi:hypothetical protein
MAQFLKKKRLAFAAPLTLGDIDQTLPARNGARRDHLAAVHHVEGVHAAPENR